MQSRWQFLDRPCGMTTYVIRQQRRTLQVEEYRVHRQGMRQGPLHLKFSLNSISKAGRECSSVEESSLAYKVSSTTRKQNIKDSIFTDTNNIWIHFHYKAFP